MILEPFISLMQKEDLKKDGTRIFVDGRLIGYYKDGKELAESIRGLRRNSKIHPHVGVFIS